MSLDYDFQDRMESGRQNAMDSRNAGQPTGKPAKGWNNRAPLPEDNETNRLYAEISGLRGDLRQVQNDAAASRLSAGAEFDALFNSAKASATVAPKTSGAGMNRAQFLDSLAELGLSHASKVTAAALGLSVRQIQRLAHGEAPVPATVALLIAAYIEHGLPQHKGTRT